MKACQVAVVTAKQESNILVLANKGIPESYNYPHDGEGKDHDSVGIFQQRAGWGTVKDRMDPVSLHWGRRAEEWLFGRDLMLII